MKKKKQLGIKTFLMIFFAIGMILSIIIFQSWLHDNKKVKDILEKERIRIEEGDNTLLDNSILKDNPDTIGWLIVDETNINYPVVQHTDNKYYLNHDFDNQRNSAGWIFLDYQNKLDDQNIVIYGHHRHDKSMFGSIDDLFNEKSNKNLEITLLTTNEKKIYKIFSIYKINKDDNYTNKNFDNLEKTIKEFQKRSEIEFNQDIAGASQIITLSTCHNNNIDRIVVHGWK